MSDQEYTTFQDAIDLIAENLRRIENFLCGKDEVDYPDEYELMRSMRFLITFLGSKKQGKISGVVQTVYTDRETKRLLDFFKRKDNINSDGSIKRGEYNPDGLEFL